MKKCEHGQELWCRTCGTVEQDPVEEKPEEKRDYSSSRPNHYYFNAYTGKMEEKHD